MLTSMIKAVNSVSPPPPLLFTPHACTKWSVVFACCRTLSVCLSVCPFICLSVCLSICLSICLSLCWHKTHQFSRSKHRNLPCLFVRYTLQVLTGVLSWHYRHTYQPHPHTTCTAWDDSFSVPRVHYTACICETTVSSYSDRSTCIAMWCAGHVLYTIWIWEREG